MGITIFRRDDKVVKARALAVALTEEKISAVLATGPAIVKRIVHVPRARCMCYQNPHIRGCPRTLGPWGAVGHPQWLVLADARGKILMDNTIVPKFYTGAWFDRAV